MRLSAVLIVKNEAPIIATCLKSIKDFDEIVIVDTGSTDGAIVSDPWFYIADRGGVPYANDSLYLQLKVKQNNVQHFQFFRTGGGR